MGKKLTREDIDNRLLQDGRGFTIVGEYVNVTTKTMFQCSHGHQWMVTTNSILHGVGCPRCSNKHSPSTDEFKEWLVEDGRGITVLGEYVNATTKTLFRCAAGHEFKTTPHHLKSGKGCIHCSGHYSPTTEEFRQWLSDSDSGITLIGEYTNSVTKTLFECRNGHQWHTRPDKIKGDRGCPSCSTSGFDPDKEAVVYGWTRNNYLKVGITNDLPRRLHEHRKHGEINMVYERHYSVGRDARDWERDFKQKHGGSYVTKAECPDGYTETFPLHLLEQLIEEKL